MLFTVRNASRTPFVLNLLAGVDYGPDLAPTEFAMDRPTSLEDGTPGIEHVRKRLPASLTWMPGEVKADLPKVVGDIEQFRTAVAQGTLVVLDQPAVPSHSAPVRVARIARGEGDGK